MESKDIIKVLKCCNRIDKKHNGCKKCPLHKGNGCIDILVENALELINRQKAEIERLKHLIETQNTMIDELNNACEKIKTEAYKEFADKLKEKSEVWEVDDYFDYVKVEDIDNLLKELTERKEDEGK